MSTSRLYRSLTVPQILKNNYGTQHTIDYALSVYEEIAYWTAFFIESDKINVLHAKRLGKITSLDLDVLLKISGKDKDMEINRRKHKAKEKEKEEIQEEEAIVRSLLMEN
jgi:hypothetical protein